MASSVLLMVLVLSSVSLNTFASIGHIPAGSPVVAAAAPAVVPEVTVAPVVPEAPVTPAVPAVPISTVVPVPPPNVVPLPPVAGPPAPVAPLIPVPSPAAPVASLPVASVGPLVQGPVPILPQKPYAVAFDEGGFIPNLGYPYCSDNFFHYYHSQLVAARVAPVAPVAPPLVEPWLALPLPLFPRKKL